MFSGLKPCWGNDRSQIISAESAKKEQKCLVKVINTMYRVDFWSILSVQQYVLWVKTLLGL